MTFLSRRNTLLRNTSYYKSQYLNGKGLFTDTDGSERKK